MHEEGHGPSKPGEENAEARSVPLRNGKPLWAQPCRRTAAGLAAVGEVARLAMRSLTTDDCFGKRLAGRIKRKARAHIQLTAGAPLEEPERRTLPWTVHLKPREKRMLEDLARVLGMTEDEVVASRLEKAWGVMEQWFSEEETL